MKSCQTYAKTIQKEGLDMKLSYIYLVLKEYDKSIKSAKNSLKKDKKYYVYSNLGHSYLLKGEKKKAYRAYKNYIEKVDSVSALFNLKADFDMLKLTYPQRAVAFDRAYAYAKKIDKETMQNYMKQFQ
jgi:tetratricopeptide (TPR) repeat protein